LLQSITASIGTRNSRSQPLFDLAYNPEEVKQRLSAIPVFAVVNNKNEFVLVTGDDGVRQLGMFFFRKEDAEGFISTVRFSLYMMISRLIMCLKLLFIFM